MPPAPLSERPEEDQPDTAAEHYVADRVPVGQDDIPVERYFSARDRIGRMRLYSSRLHAFVGDGKAGPARDASLGQWTWLGPGNAGGRSRALVINPLDPNIMYTAGVAGGVWKTVDGGGSWFSLTDFLPNIAVNSLAIDPVNPETVYAGTGEGYANRGRVRGAGIFKTTDGGANWIWLENSNRNTLWYVNRIVISKADSRRVYAATWSGVFRSLDAGKSWDQVLAINAGGLGCQELVIHSEQDKDTLFAGCHGSPQSYIWRNTDAGGSARWQAVFSAPFMARIALAIAPSRPRTIYAIAESSMPGTCPANPGPRPAGQCFRLGFLALWRSNEGGDPDTWEERTNNQSDNPINPGLFSNSQGYYRDLCSGGLKSFSSQGWYDMALAVDPLDSEIVWVGGIDLFRSNDGGANFGIASFWNAARDSTSWVHSDQHLIVFHPNYNGDSNQMLYTANDGGVFLTRNARADVATGAQGPCRATNTQIRWMNLNNNLGITQFYHGAVFPGGHAFLGGTQDNATQFGLLADGPNRWLNLIGGDGGYVAVNPKDPRIVYGTTTNLALRRSDNGAVSFASAISGIAEPSSNFDFIAPYRMDPSDPDCLWIGGRSLWRTTDGARNWVKASVELNADNAINAIAISPVDPNRILAATRDGRIYRTGQGLASNSDTPFESVRPRTGIVSWLEFHPGNPSIAWATYSSFNSGAQDRHIYKTEDGGITWTGLDGVGDTAIPDIPVHTVIPHPDNPETLYAGTDMGVFVSLDGGITWAREDLGVPYTTVETLVLEKSGIGYWLYAFMHGRGAYRVWLGPSEPCKYEVNAEAVQASRAASSFVFEVATGEGCRWSALPGANWLSFAAPPVGTGPGRVEVRMSQSAAARRGVVYVADKAITVTQQ